MNNKQKEKEEIEGEDLCNGLCMVFVVTMPSNVLKKSQDGK